jgi:hypothetical protein
VFNPLNAKLNPICHLPALLGAHHIFRVSRTRVNPFSVAAAIARYSWPTVEPPKDVLCLVVTPAPCAVHYLPDVFLPLSMSTEAWTKPPPRRLTASDICHVVIANNICVNGMARRLEGNIAK